MPAFLLTDKSGSKFKIDAPDEQSAYAAFQKMQGGEKSGVVEDVAKSVGSGLATGTMGVAGLPGDIAGFLDWGAKSAVEAGRNAIFGKRSPEEQARYEKFVSDNQGVVPPPPTTQTIQKGVTAATGFEPYKPQTTAGKYANTAASFVPGAIALGGLGSGVRGAATAAVNYGVVPGLTSEAAGQSAQKFGFGDYEPYARMGGALAGAAIPSLVRRVVTPFPSSPERQAAVNALRNEGVTDLTAGQMTGSKPLRYFESEVGGGRVADMLENQGDQFTSAALRRVGEDATRASPEVIDRAFTRIGQQFDDLSRNNALRFDPQLNQDLVAAINDYTTMVPPSQQARVVGDITGDIAGAMQANTAMPGDVYQALRSRLGKAAQAARVSDPQMAEALRGIQGALDDAMERSIAATNPADLGAFREARNQYRNMLVIERAATGGGENAALGIISPAKLREAAVAQSRRGYARGQGDFDELARSGSAVMAPMPESGTAGRLAARGIGSGIGGIIGTSSGGLPGGIAGAIAGQAAPAVLGRIALGPARPYLSNQLMRPSESSVEALAAALANASLPARSQPLGITGRR